MDDVGERSSAPLFTDGPPPALSPIAGPPPPAPVDDKSIRAGIEMVVSLAEGLAKTKIQRVGKEVCLPKPIVDTAKNGAKIEPEIRDPLLDSYFLTFKKYFPNTPLGPEAAAISGTLLVLKGWKELIADLREMGREMQEQKTPESLVA